MRQDSRSVPLQHDDTSPLHLETPIQASSGTNQLSITGTNIASLPETAAAHVLPTARFVRIVAEADDLLVLFGQMNSSNVFEVQTGNPSTPNANSIKVKAGIPEWFPVHQTYSINGKVPALKIKTASGTGTILYSLSWWD